MKKLILLLLVLCSAKTLTANHLKGGWISYEYLRPGTDGNSSVYRINVNQYLDSSSTPQQIDDEIYLGVFNLDNNSSETITLNRAPQPDFLFKTTYSACVNPKPSVFYRIDKYTTTIELAHNTRGYTFTVQRCCRIAGIVNVANSSTVGVSYTNTIPGSINGRPYHNNSSPVFVQKDTALICYSSPVELDFSATDPDGDSLVYVFTEGIIGGGMGFNQAKPRPPSAPPYGSVPYSIGYSGSSPLGNQITINSSTGLITGIAPSQTGDYVLAVMALEYRNGVLIGTTRKEIHVTVANCSLSAAQLDAQYISCNSYTNTFFNQSTNSNITSYLWDFGTGNPNDTSHAPSPTFTYKDTGVYTIKLKAEAGAGCEDSTTARVRVFPGFVPNFTIKGSCYLNPYQFNDVTYTAFGKVDSWRWDFGDATTGADTSRIQHPQYKYASPVNDITIQLTVSNDKGCVETITKTLTVFDKPPIFLPFRDTLICSIDTLPLIASSTANSTYSWTPGPYLLNPNTATPLAFPKDTTTYIVSVNDDGCINTDSIKVNVLDYITVELPRDTTICQFDSITLRPVSHGLGYSWEPPVQFNNPRIKYPKVAPASSMELKVQANLGGCTARDSMFVKVVPYPVVVGTGDTTICFAATTQIHASTVAASHRWSPVNSLLYTNTLHPLAGPQATTMYYITVTDTLGCPKPVTDSVLVKVIPRVRAFAGNDTMIVVGQPLQLQATGGARYTWSPDIGISNRSVANPIVQFGEGVDSILYTVRAYTPEGCYGDDNIMVRLLSISPDILVPSGFTPNGDGKNDILKPIIAGIKKLNSFRIYNRWGELLYSTSEAGKGWDGTYGGVEQAAGTYVYVASAINYLDQPVERRGTVVLIR